MTCCSVDGVSDVLFSEHDVDDEEWAEDQRRADRQWYSIDDGYDETHNPFAGMLILVELMDGVGNIM